MANNNEKMWLNSELDLQEEFNKGSFSKLIEYSDANILHIMKLWLNENQDWCRKTLRVGFLLLSFFERFITQDLKNSAIFKLGELSGHIKCLDRILYEIDQNDLAKVRLETLSLMHPEYSENFKNIIMVIFREKGIIGEDQLLNKVQLEPEKFRDILNVLFTMGIINYSEHIGCSLSDIGYKIAEQLTATIN